MLFDAFIIIIIAIIERALLKANHLSGASCLPSCSVLTETLEESVLRTWRGSFVFTVLSTSVTLLNLPNNLLTQRFLLSPFYRQELESTLLVWTAMSMRWPYAGLAGEDVTVW